MTRSISSSLVQVLKFALMGLAPTLALKFAPMGQAPRCPHRGAHRAFGGEHALAGLFGVLALRGVIQMRQRFGNSIASHRAIAALTDAGFSWAIKCPDLTTASLRRSQFLRIGSASRESIVSQI